MSDEGTHSTGHPQGGDPRRRLGLFDTTLVGVGAIVGGGVLALAGVAFSLTGPSAILAFALNGLIAGITALQTVKAERNEPSIWRW